MSGPAFHAGKGSAVVKHHYLSSPKQSAGFQGNRERSPRRGRTGQELDRAGVSTGDSIHGAVKRGHSRAAPKCSTKAASKDYTAAKTLGKEQEPV